MKKTTVAPGIYRDGYCYEVRAGRNGRGGVRSKCFPLDTTVAEMQAWRQQQPKRTGREELRFRYSDSAPFWRDVRAKAEREGIPLRSLIISLLTEWITR